MTVTGSCLGPDGDWTKAPLRCPWVRHMNIQTRPLSNAHPVFTPANHPSQAHAPVDRPTDAGTHPRKGATTHTPQTCYRAARTTHSQPPTHASDNTANTQRRQAPK